MQVRLTDDPVKVLSAAGRFLAGRPVHHNLVLSLLAARVDAPEPGRYGWVAGGEGFAGIGGVIFDSPLDFPATVTPMAPAAAAALGEAVARAWPDLAGVNGEAATAAAFAGAYAVARGTPARPIEAQRLYRLEALRAPPPPAGRPRLALPADRDVVARFVGGFHEDVGEHHRPGTADDDRTAVRLIANGRLWLWETPAAEAAAPAEVVAMAQATGAQAGVARVGPVYTVPAARGRGFGGAVTAAATRAILDGGATAVLYTQLDNPTSNALYQRLGYQVVAEVLHYGFG